jgi:hypothetical protein
MLQFVRYVQDGNTVVGQTDLSQAELEVVIPGISGVEFSVTPFPPIPITSTTLARDFGIVSGTTTLSEAKDKTKGKLNRLTNAALASSDWYVSRLVEVGTAIPAGITTYRSTIRSFNNTKTAAIDNALSVSAVVSLFAPAPSGVPGVFDLPA